MRSRHSLFVHSPELLVFFCSWKMGDVWDAAALGSVCALDVPKKRAFVPPDWTVRNRIVVVVCVSAAERNGNRTDFFLFRVGIGTLSVRRPSNRNCLSVVYLALQCRFSADSHGFVYSDAAKSSAYADGWFIACRGHSFDAVHLGGIGYFFTALSGLLLVQLQGHWFFFFWDTGKYLLSALTAVAVWMLYDRKQEESVLRNLMACICSILAFLWLLPLSILPALLGWVLLEAVLFVMWHVRKQNGCLYLGYVLFLFGIRLILSKISVLDDITLQYGAWVAIDIAVTLYLRHCRSHRGMEILSLCVTGWLMVEGWCLLLLEGLFRSVASFWHAIGSLFRQTGSDAGIVIPWDTILLAAFVVLIFLLNVPYLLRKYPNQNGVGVYLCIRMTLLGAVVSGAFFQRAAWSSGLLTLLSFGMLLVGFRFHQKGLRIYSLIAMMVFLCKLLLLDLSYQTPLLWAGAFLICGLLCFGISFAYNRIGRQTESPAPVQPEPFEQSMQNKGEQS